ncbi:MAG TPA: hypothetical protein VLB09_01280, partial [Nitrospiria bacterium]|nr:hypothetical protein [Nitrospiria bacterium]
IAYVSKRFTQPEVYIMDVAGSEDGIGQELGKVRNLTRHPARDEGPTWSPDGRFIAFVSDREGARNLYVVPSTGGQTRRIGTLPVQAGPARWSTDGSWLAYVGGNKEDQRIQLVSADGQNTGMMGWDRGEMTELQWMPSIALDGSGAMEMTQ